MSASDRTKMSAPSTTEGARDATARSFDRRDFLKMGGVAGGGLMIGFALPMAEAAGRELPAAAPSAALQPNGFLRIEPTGRVTIWVGRADMGQGVRTALPMIVADELEANWESVEVLQADGHPDLYGSQNTVGSTSVRGNAWMALRRAGAAGREMLVLAAAATWGVSPTDCVAREGRVIHRGSGQELTYGQLADQANQLPVPDNPRLKDASEFRLIGTRVPLRDVEDKVTGRAVFGIDARVPGMLFATVVHSPILGGTVASFDAESALAVAGVRHVVQISRGIAVVAENTWAAFQGAAATDIEWTSSGFTLGSSEIETLFREMAEEPGAIAVEEGDVEAALDASRSRITAEYTLPYLAHATMEPMNCTADVRPDRCELWVPTQNPQGAQRAAATLAGLPLESVQVHVTLLGCGWGRRSSTDFVEEAVETSMAVGGPVQVLWTREEDMRNDNYRPFYFSRLEGGIDADGRVTALTARLVATPLLSGGGGGGGRGGRGGGAPRADRNGVDGVANAMYSYPALRVDNHPAYLGVPTGYWRSVGPSAGTFILESFIDELAHEGGRDPFDLRMELLAGHSRGLRMMRQLKEVSGWSTPLQEGWGRGVAIVQDKGSVVGHVAEVSMRDNSLHVERIVCVADCGQVIHPGIVEQQMVGSVVAGLSAVFHNEITIDRGRVVQGNFNDYEMLRISEMPEVEVHIVATDEAPGSVGEPGVPSVAPAVTNALFALTGRRVRSLPIRL